jgi:hypothetical protein
MSCDNKDWPNCSPGCTPNPPSTTTCPAGTGISSGTCSPGTPSSNCPKGPSGNPCSNQGSCSNGVCNCNKGWIGDACQTKSSEPSPGGSETTPKSNNTGLIIGIIVGVFVLISIFILMKIMKKEKGRGIKTKLLAGSPKKNKNL